MTRIDTLSQDEIEKIKRLQENDKRGIGYKKVMKIINIRYIFVWKCLLTDNKPSGYKRYRDEELREMEEIYGDFAAALGDRVKKRRRINYCEDDDDDDVMTLDELESKRRRRRHYSDDSRSPSPEGDILATLYYLTSPFYFRVRFCESTAENYQAIVKPFLLRSVVLNTAPINIMRQYRQRPLADSKHLFHNSLSVFYAVARRKKDRRRMDHSNLSLEELMETGTFKKFHKSIESVIESAEDVDLNMLNSSKYLDEV